MFPQPCDLPISIFKEMVSMKISMDIYNDLIKQIEDIGKKFEKLDLPLETLLHDHNGNLLKEFLINYKK